MGKALLILVVGSGLLLASGLFSNQQTARETAEDQAGYEEEVVAREIARSGFNVAMGILRSHGGDLQGGINAILNGNEFMEAEHQGGTYRVWANFTSGHTVEVTSVGYFGGSFDEESRYHHGAVHIMGDAYHARNTIDQTGDEDDPFVYDPPDEPTEYSPPTPPLSAKEQSRLQITFLESNAGYCSAMFLERHLPDGTVMAPEMLFPASHNGDVTTLSIEKIIDSGTQMNFFIGVDQNCSTRPAGTNGPRNYNVLNHVYRASDYDHIHYALDIPVGNLANMQESPWALVEQHPTGDQRWRIGWEDIHNTSWNNPNGTNPATSLQALKRFGYDTNNDGHGDGWTRVNDSSYRTLRDGGLDLSDQVIDITLVPIAPIASGGGSGESEPIPGGGEEGGSGSSGSGSGSAPCGCPEGGGNKKVAIMHRPPGNERNEQSICVAPSGAENHLRRHNDYVICEGH